MGVSEAIDLSGRRAGTYSPPKSCERRQAISAIAPLATSLPCFILRGRSHSHVTRDLRCITPLEAIHLGSFGALSRRSANVRFRETLTSLQ